MLREAVAGRGRAGSSLIEVVIATLLALIAGSSIAAMALTGNQLKETSLRRTQATQVMRRVSESLKQYRTASTTVLSGPGGAPNGWGLPGDACGCAAFQNGRHVLDPAVWAPELAAYGGTVSYTVTTRNTNLGPQPTVDFSVNWTQP